MAELSVAEFVSRLPQAFIPAKAAGVDAIIQLKFTGAQADQWIVTIKDSQCTVTQGIAHAPKLTVAADSGDLIKIFTGQLDGMQAFMQGKLRLTGDLNLAMKLLGLFKVQ